MVKLNNETLWKNFSESQNISINYLSIPGQVN